MITECLPSVNQTPIIMNTKALLAALAGAVFSFLAGWVVFGMLLMDFYMSNTTQYEGLMKGEMPNLVLIFISGLSSSLLIAYIFSKWANVKTFGAGLMNGVIIYFFIVTSFDLSMYAFYNLMNVTLVCVDIVVGTIFGGLMGGVIGLVLGMGKKE